MPERSIEALVVTVLPGTSWVYLNGLYAGLLEPGLKENPRFLEPNLSRNIDATEGFRRLAGEMGTTASSLAIAWLLHQGDHIIPISGTRSIEHLTELAVGASIKLSKDDLDAIDHVLPIGWAYGDRYSLAQWNGPEKYC